MLFNSVSKDIKAKVLLMWRVWHLRNNIVHGKGLAMVFESAEFLTSYAKSLNIARRTEAGGPSDKGKGKVYE
jgi:hypothetical protein